MTIRDLAGNALVAGFSGQAYTVNGLSDTGMYRPQFPVSAAANTAGGRGGQVYRIQVLSNDTDPPINNGDGTKSCSFRRALQIETGPRIIIPEVSGYVNNEDDPIVITDGNITFAGQTAPAGGICFINEGFQILADDIVFQHFAVRGGNWPGNPVIPETARRDNLLVYDLLGGGKRVFFDHMSTTWACGKNFLFATDGDVGAWRCLNAEALYRASTTLPFAGGSWSDPQGQVSSLGLLAGNCASAVDGHYAMQSVFAHNSDRNPEQGSGNIMNFINNIIYDWGRDESGYVWGSFWYPGSNPTTNPTFANYIGNRYIGGISPHPFLPLYAMGVWSYYPGSQLYRDDNTLDQTVQAVTDLFINPDGPGDPSVGSPAIPIPTGYTPLSSASMQSFILANVGARPLDRSSIDTRIINSINNYTGTVISTQASVGGYPAIPFNQRSFQMPSNPNGTSPRRGAPFTILEDALEDYAMALEPL